MSGVAYAIEGPITLSLLTEMLDDKKYGREIGIVEFAKEISVAIASLVAGIVVVIIGYEAVFLLGAVFQIASVIILNNYL
jgi:MFS family permease